MSGFLNPPLRRFLPDNGARKRGVGLMQHEVKYTL
jgi:hypothetical protein